MCVCVCVCVVTLCVLVLKSSRHFCLRMTVSTKFVFYIPMSRWLYLLVLVLDNWWKQLLSVVVGVSSVRKFCTLSSGNKQNANGGSYSYCYWICKHSSCKASTHTILGKAVWFPGDDLRPNRCSQDYTGSWDAEKWARRATSWRQSKTI